MNAPEPAVMPGLNTHRLRRILLAAGAAFAALAEGWALYCEELMWEQGYFTADPLTRLFQLHDLQFRACRAVLDAALHAGRMSPEERSFDNIVQRLPGGRFRVRDQYAREYRVVDRQDLGGISLEQRADPDFFYRNDGAGHFVRERVAGNRRFLDEHGHPLKSEPEEFGLAAMLADLNGDGAPDLYVVNDFEDPDLFWLNDGHGNFRLTPPEVIRATSNSGMAVRYQ